MQFMIRYRDRDGAGEIRREHRAAHTNFRKGLGEQRVLSGPLLADDCATPVGSLLILEASDLDTARDLAASDPFVKLGALDLIEVVPMEVRIARPVRRGGKE